MALPAAAPAVTGRSTIFCPCLLSSREVSCGGAACGHDGDRADDQPIGAAELAAGGRHRRRILGDGLILAPGAGDEHARRRQHQLRAPSRSGTTNSRSSLSSAAPVRTTRNRHPQLQLARRRFEADRRRPGAPASSIPVPARVPRKYVAPLGRGGDERHRLAPSRAERLAAAGTGSHRNVTLRLAVVAGRGAHPRAHERCRAPVRQSTPTRG